MSILLDLTSDILERVGLMLGERDQIYYASTCRAIRAVMVAAAGHAHRDLLECAASGDAFIVMHHPDRATPTLITDKESVRMILGSDRIGVLLVTRTEWRIAISTVLEVSVGGVGCRDVARHARLGTFHTEMTASEAAMLWGRLSTFAPEHDAKTAIIAMCARFIKRIANMNHIPLPLAGAWFLRDIRFMENPPLEDFIIVLLLCSAKVFGVLPERRETSEHSSAGLTFLGSSSAALASLLADCLTHHWRPAPICAALNYAKSVGIGSELLRAINDAYIKPIVSFETRNGTMWMFMSGTRSASTSFLGIDVTVVGHYQELLTDNRDLALCIERRIEASYPGATMFSAGRMAV